MYSPIKLEELRRDLEVAEDVLRVATNAVLAAEAADLEAEEWTRRVREAQAARREYLQAAEALRQELRKISPLA